MKRSFYFWWKSKSFFFFNGWCFWWNLKQTQDNKENSSQGSGPSLTSTSYKWQAKKNSLHIRLSKFKKKKERKKPAQNPYKAITRKLGRKKNRKNKQQGNNNLTSNNKSRYIHTWNTRQLKMNEGALYIQMQNRSQNMLLNEIPSVYPICKN